MASLGPYVLLEAGPDVYLDKFLHQDKDISLQPGFFFPLKFDGSSYTDEMFWATMSQANGNVTQVCTVQVTETLSATPTVSIITSTPYVSATWPSPAPMTPTAVCNTPGQPFAWLGIPGYATAVNSASNVNATAGPGVFDCWMGLGRGSTTVETWSITRTSTFTCGASTTQIPAPDLLCTFTLQNSLVTGVLPKFDILTTSPYFTTNIQTAYPGCTSAYPSMSGKCIPVPTGGSTDVSTPAGCGASQTSSMSATYASASASAGQSSSAPSSTPPPSSQSQSQSAAGASSGSISQTASSATASLTASVSSASYSAAGGNSQSQSAPAVSASGSGGTPNLPYLMLNISSNQLYVNATNPDNWWGGFAPFWRNFPFDENTGYTSEGFMLSAYDTAVQTVTATAKCTIGITASVSGYPTLSLQASSPYPVQPTATGNAAWRSRARISSDSQPIPSQPDLNALRAYAHHLVPVADTRQREFSEFERTERRLGELLDLWESGEGGGLYVKDWHLVAQLEHDGGHAGQVYEVPLIFRDDWLNPPDTHAAYSRQEGPASDRDKDPIPSGPTDSSPPSISASDFRFTYAGPSGTFTPLHRDVYASYSWSANVVGRKVWWLFPPEAVGRLLQLGKGDLPFDVRDLGVGVDVESELEAAIVLQEEGEIIFVPSGWHHQVVNLDFCISINHNFFSSLALPRVYAALHEAQRRVEDSIADVKDMIISRLGTRGPAEESVKDWEREWTDEVQGLLERDAGWGWKGFWETVRRNVVHPPAEPEFSPPSGLRLRSIVSVFHQYQYRREWAVLDNVRALAEDAISSLSVS